MSERSHLIVIITHAFISEKNKNVFLGKKIKIGIK